MQTEDIIDIDVSAEEAIAAEEDAHEEAEETETDTAEDTQTLHEAFPETRRFSSPEEMPVYERYAALRSMGLSVKEAYAAANCENMRYGASGLEGTKSHLRSNVPKGASSGKVSMSRSELAQWRDLFPGKSDREIADLYRRAMKA